jgi:hypothetical protein
MSSYVNNRGHSYKNLQNYNNRNAPGSMVVPAPKGANYQIVPSYGGSIGYDALTHGVNPSFAGYFAIKNAYGCDSEPTYNKRNC